MARFDCYLMTKVVEQCQRSLFKLYRNFYFFSHRRRVIRRDVRKSLRRKIIIIRQTNYRVPRAR